MIPVATIAQMQECDRMTIDELGLPGMVLMEYASRAVADVAIEMLDGNPAGKLVRIFCGKGNNGGDGFAVARHLKNAGAVIELFLIGKTADLQGDALLNCELHRMLGGQVREIATEADFKPAKKQPDLVVDALLGTGFKGIVKGIHAQTIDLVNSSDAPVLAVDIPSGVEGDNGAAGDIAVRAERTATFGLLKPGLLLPPGRELCGSVTVADIGIPPQVVQKQNIRQFLVEACDVIAKLPRLKPSDHKGKAGHVFILAGSPGLTGAVALAAEASIRSGAGLTVVGVPGSLNHILEVKLTESMTLPLPANDSDCLTTDAFDLCLDRLKWAHAVAFGPGIGRHPDTGKLLAKLLAVLDKPFVIDADGLNLLADNPSLLKKLPPGTILTPHPGEFSRLSGLSVTEIAADRIGLTRQWAAKWKAVLVLKGAPSITALPDGTIFINPTGNEGMATGGSGDVLTGVISSLLAQGLNAGEAAWMGCYLHGAAGDRAAEKLGKHGMVAGDIIIQLPSVIREVE